MHVREGVIVRFHRFVVLPIYPLQLQLQLFYLLLHNQVLGQAVALLLLYLLFRQHSIYRLQVLDLQFQSVDLVVFIGDDAVVLLL